MRQQIIDQKAKELKQYVGLAMSLDECEDFVSGVVEQLATNGGSADVRECLIEVNETLERHGKIDANTELHGRIRNTL